MNTHSLLSSQVIITVFIQSSNQEAITITPSLAFSKLKPLQQWRHNSPLRVFLDFDIFFFLLCPKIDDRVKKTGQKLTEIMDTLCEGCYSLKDENLNEHIFKAHRTADGQSIICPICLSKPLSERYFNSKHISSDIHKTEMKEKRIL
jgi:hypothetical protein